MRTSRIVKIILAFAFLVACNAAVTFALEPYGSISDVEWTEYRQTEELDTIFIGSSYVQAGIDPVQLDALIGTESFCLATPAQRLEESFVGIRQAVADHHIKRVVLGVSPSAFTDSTPPSPNTAYLKQWRKSASTGEAARVAADFLVRQGAIASEESINCLFTWKNYHVTLRPANIINNIKNKIAQSDLVDAMHSIEEVWQYTGRGHGANIQRLDLNWAMAEPFDTTIGNDLDKIDGRMVAAQRERTLREICTYCADNNVQLMLVSMPLPTYNILDDESHYTDIMEAIEEILADYDVPFYDFNYLDERYFVPDPSLYSDSTHLNDEGARVFTDVFAQFFGDWINGKDVEGYFVDPAQATKGMDYVSVLFAEGHSEEDAIEVDCRAITGPGIEVEYQLCTYIGNDLQKSKWSDPYDDLVNWEPVSEWTSSPLLVWDPGKSGTYNLRAFARKVGSPLPFDHFRDVTVVY